MKSVIARLLAGIVHHAVLTFSMLQHWHDVHAVQAISSWFHSNL